MKERKEVGHCGVLAICILMSALFLTVLSIWNFDFIYFLFVTPQPGFVADGTIELTVIIVGGALVLFFFLAWLLGRESKKEESS